LAWFWWFEGDLTAVPTHEPAGWVGRCPLDLILTVSLKAHDDGEDPLQLRLDVLLQSQRIEPALAARN
jgi:hypothetical protein